MGYILVIAGLALMALVLFPLLTARRAPRPRGGTIDPERPVVRSEPSSDEATPGDSGVAPQRQQDDAQRRTPPA